MQAVRIGFGYDVHALGKGDNLIIGGVHIPSDRMAIGHSDADVLIHAICDAMLGALNMRDIGYNFPDTDPQFKGIDSAILLKEVLEKVSARGYSIGNMDATICLEKPKINPFIPQMVTTLAKVLNTEEENISLKATTTEKLGFVGREEGISAYAVVLLMKNS